MNCVSYCIAARSKSGSPAGRQQPCRDSNCIAACGYPDAAQNRPCNPTRAATGCSTSQEGAVKAPNLRTKPCARMDVAQFNPSSNECGNCRHLANSHRPLMLGAPFPNIIHSHPTGNGKKCWLDPLNLPQGRHEKQKNQTNTMPV